MKVFIIFLSLLLINMSFLIYQGDMSGYMRTQKNLKALAEEGAAGAALYFDEEEYAEGRYVFSYEEGEKYVDFLIEQSGMEEALRKPINIGHEMTFEDDLQGYEKEEIPSVTVALKLNTEDMFRLPFLTVREITRESKYELPE